MQFDELPEDVVELVVSHMDSVDTLCNAARVSRACATLLLREPCWRALAVGLYGCEFWRRAGLRPLHTSQPLGSWKGELLRVEQFQDGVARWHRRLHAADFYHLWECLDGLHMD